MLDTPKVTLANYVSYMVSPYNAWFRDLGYPELDVISYDDGEWAIIQYHKSPVIPHLTPWSFVLKRIRHLEKSPAVFKKYTDQLDLEKRHVWAKQDADDRELSRSLDEEDRRFEDKSKRIVDSVMRNDDLVQRVARNGLGELSLRSISRHIPNHRFRR